MAMTSARGPRSVRVPVPGGELAVEVLGEGPAVVLHPSLGRWARDFVHLAPALAAAGFQAVSLDPRGVGDSTGDLDGLTMPRCAEDVIDVMAALGIGRAHLAGHALGNRVVRQTATLWPERVRTVALLAAGGRFPGDAEATAAVSTCFRTDLAEAERMEAVATAFFAPDNDPTVWSGGWFPAAAAAQGQAATGSSSGEWWDAGSVPMLVVQGLQDRVAPPANGRALLAERAAPTELVEIDGAGHALLPEQPELVAQAVIGFLKRH